MAMRAFLACLSLLLPLSRIASISASTFYVSSSVSASGNGQSWQTAFKKIQEGIDAASDGDTVTVAEGTYVENVKFNAKNILLRSINPLDPTVVANTIIDGNKAGSVVTFYGTEVYCVLSGFTIRNGKSDDGGGGVCGGTEQRRCLAGIEHNIVTENSTVGWGPGVAFCDGRVENNTFTRNSGDSVIFCDGTIEGNDFSDNSGGINFCNGTIRKNTMSRKSNGGIGHCDGLIENNVVMDQHTKGWGAGICYCNGTIRGNIIQRNSVRGYWYGVGNPPSPEWEPGEGGGIYECDGLIENNTVADYAALGAGAQGGGIAFCDGTIQNNLIVGNNYEAGGGVAYCEGTIQNNTVVANSQQALFCVTGTIRNCIIWGNLAKWGEQVYECVPPTYSCIHNWTAGGRGNITEDPRFLDADGLDNNPDTRGDNDYRLRDDSPCLNAGINFFWFAWPQADLDGNCRLAGDRVDMGCYERDSSLDSDGDLLSDADESTLGTNDHHEDTDGDGLRDGLEVLRGTNPTALTPAQTLGVPSPFPRVQVALCLAVPGDEIVVGPGTYVENLHFPGVDVVLRGTDPTNWM